MTWEETALLLANKRLEKENAVLKAKLTANRFIFRTTVRNEYLDKIEELEDKLASIKTLDREEVEKIFDTLETEEDVYENQSSIFGIDNAITAICNLTLINKDNIVAELKSEFITNFCNDHNGETRWLRSIALDMPDLLDSILDFFDGKRSFTIVKAIGGK